MASFLVRRSRKDGSWQEFFENPSLWWDNRSKNWNNYPDFKHVSSDQALWIHSCPPPLRSRLTTLQDAPLDQRACRASYKVSPLPEERTGHHPLEQLQPVQISAHLISDTVSALKSCTSLEKGREIHVEAAHRGLDRDLYVANSLISMYTRCHSLVDARVIFDRLVNRDVISYNALMMGYVLNGESYSALKLFEGMTLKPNRRTWIPALMACADIASKSAGSDVQRVLELGTGIHRRVAREGSNVYVDNTLVDMYCKCGRPEEARKVFDGMEARNVVSWNAMIHGYVCNGENTRALELFERMDCLPNGRTYVGALVACVNLAEGGDGASKERVFQLGERIHSQADKNSCSDFYVKSSLINFYSKCGKLLEARKVFDTISRPCTVSWNMLLQAYVENGEPEACLRLFKDMQCVPNAGSFVQALKACADSAAKDRKRFLKLGKEIHSLARVNNFSADIFVEGTLVDMYVKCGSLKDARSVLDGTSNRSNVAAWNAMLWGYVNAGRHDQAVSLFSQMKSESCCVVPDRVTYAAVITCFGEVMALKAGEELHKVIRSQGLERKRSLATCLVEFYGKCGEMELAEEAFRSMALKDVDLVAWNTLMAGYSRQGRSDVALQVLQRMIEHGSQPNHVTFLLLLSAFSQSQTGLIVKVNDIFEEMSTRYGLTPSREHYTCLVNVLGRAGRLQEAFQLVQSMPFQPDAAVWRALLISCRRWNNVTLGREAFESLVKVGGDSVSAVAYVHMASIYGSSGMLKEQAEVLATRKRLKVVKEPSTSWWTDDEGNVHKFYVGEQQCLETENKLTELLGEMKEHGYVVDVRSVCGDVAEEERAHSVCSHSEKLAIAHAFVNTSPGTTIRISNSLRLCEDCHNVIALVSKFKHRKIICRDPSVLHVFENGRCACTGNS